MGLSIPEIEKMSREAYRAGQKSVDCMKVIRSGQMKPSHFCEDEPCKHKISEETSTAEDEAIKKILSSAQ